MSDGGTTRVLKVVLAVVLLLCAVPLSLLLALVTEGLFITHRFLTPGIVVGLVLGSASPSTPESQAFHLAWVPPVVDSLCYWLIVAMLWRLSVVLRRRGILRSQKQAVR